jgi:hypothetical protein
MHEQAARDAKSIVERARTQRRQQESRTKRQLQIFPVFLSFKTQ